MKLVFAGTSEFAVPVLSALANAGHEVVLTLTRPARPAGRGRRLHKSPVQLAAERAGLALETPPTLNDCVLRQRLTALAPEVLVVVAYGRLVPPALLRLPRLGAVNVHPSLLPRWRGAAPVERAILAGDRETGVAVMRMSEELDAGPVYRSARTPIGSDETAGELGRRLAEFGARLLLETLNTLAADETRARPQRGAVTYAERVSSREARLDFGRPATELARRIRAFNPRPVAWGECGGERLRFLRAAALDEAVAVAPGTIVSAAAAGVDIATAQGLLRVTELQRAGRRLQRASEFAHGQQWVGRRIE